MGLRLGGEATRPYEGSYGDGPRSQNRIPGQVDNEEDDPQEEVGDQPRPHTLYAMLRSYGSRR